MDDRCAFDEVPLLRSGTFTGVCLFADYVHTLLGLGHASFRDVTWYFPTMECDPISGWKMTGTSKVWVRNFQHPVKMIWICNGSKAQDGRSAFVRFVVPSSGFFSLVVGPVDEYRTTGHLHSFPRERNFVRYTYPVSVWNHRYGDMENGYTNQSIGLRFARPCKVDWKIWCCTMLRHSDTCTYIWCYSDYSLTT